MEFLKRSRFFTSIRSLLSFNNKLIANVRDRGILISEDNGKTWTLNPIPNIDGNGVIYAQNNTLYLMSEYRGLLSSTNLGNWKEINKFEPTTYNSIIVNNETIIVGGENGLMLSNDNGFSLDYIFKGFNAVKVNNVICINENIFALSNWKLYHSIDNGNEWVSNKLNEVNDYLYCFDTYANMVIVGGNKFIHLSSNLGQNWKSIELSENMQNINSIELFDKTIIVGTISAVYISSDLGESWELYENSNIFGNKLKILFIKINYMLE